MNRFQRVITRVIGLKDFALLHPEFSNRTLLYSGMADEATPAIRTGIASNYSCNPWVFKATSIIARVIRAIELNVVDAEGKEIEGHPVNAFLDAPNPTVSGAALWDAWVTDLYLQGDTGIEIVMKGSTPKELWARPGKNVSINIASNRYQKASSYVLDDGFGEPYSVPTGEFIFSRFVNPDNIWRGLSPFMAAAMSISIDNRALKWEDTLFRDMARPDYVVVAPQGMTPDERRQILADLDAQTRGKNKGVVLEQGITDIKPLSFSPKDTVWEKMREMSREEIGAVAGVPDEMMGWGRDTYENFGTAQRVLYSETIKPVTDMRDAALTHALRNLGALKDGEQVSTNYKEVSALRDDRGKIIEQAKGLYSMRVPFNVIDEKLGLGIGAIVGGDVAPELSGFGSPVSAQPEPEQAPPAKARTKAIEIDWSFGSDAHKAALTAWETKATSHEKKLGAAVAALFEQQRAEVLEKIGAPTGKAATDEGGPFSKQKWERLFRAKLGPIIRAIIADSGRDALREVAVGVSFEVQDPAVVKFMKEREQRFAERVNDTTWTQLKDSLADGVGKGETIAELAARVESVMDGRINSSATTIARTEVIGAANGGTVAGWKQSGVVQGKRWLTSLDERVRDTHVEAQGQVVGIDEDFEVGDGRGQSPGQIGLAEEDINCFPGDAIVYAEGVKRGMQRMYTGEMVELLLNTGDKITVTPNHPILGEFGWKGAGQFQHGDNLVGYDLIEFVGGCDPNPYDAPTQFIELGLFRDVPFQVNRVAGANPQFHGDGMEGHVDVVSVNRQLGGEIVSFLGKPSAQHILAAPDVLHGGLVGDSAQLQLGDATTHTTNGIMRSSGELGAIFGGGLSHAGEHGRATVAGGNTALNQSAADNLTGYAEACRDGLFAHPGKVTLTKIVGINRVSFHGHVYNLETDSGLYLSNGIIAHNCRCTVGAVLDMTRTIGPAQSKAADNNNGMSNITFSPVINIPAPVVNVAGAVVEIPELMAAPIINLPEMAVTVAAPIINLPPPVVNVDVPAPVVNMPAQAAPVVNVAAPRRVVGERKTIIRDAAGNIERVDVTYIYE